MNENKCPKGLPTLEIEAMPNSISTYKYSINGVQTWYDHEPMVYQTQTDTVLIADAVNRLLNYQAERHTDTISAKELGGILHLADLADVDATDVEDNSMFFYHKDDECGSGCQGTSNSWKAWNALDNKDSTSVPTAQFPMAFTSTGSPVSIPTPTNAGQYYQLGWNAGNKLSYSQPTIVASVPLDTDNKKWSVYVDPTSYKLVIVKESAS